jgi:hypothetical protein
VYPISVFFFTWHPILYPFLHRELKHFESLDKTSIVLPDGHWQVVVQTVGSLASDSVVVGNTSFTAMSYVGSVASISSMNLFIVIREIGPVKLSWGSTSLKVVVDCLSFSELNL